MVFRVMLDWDRFSQFQFQFQLLLSVKAAVWESCIEKPDAICASGFVGVDVWLSSPFRWIIADRWLFLGMV